MPVPDPERGELQPLSEVDRAVHEPARLMILALLVVVESADFLFVMNQTGLTRGNLSSHMSKLEEVGYITIRKEFRDRVPHTLLRITKSGRRALQDYRRRMLRALDDLPR
jgi:DNA-binding transcriptional ArsR family regulator